MHNFTDVWELPGVVWKFDSFTRPSREDGGANDRQKQALTVEAGFKRCIRAMPGISGSQIRRGQHGRELADCPLNTRNTLKGCEVGNTNTPCRPLVLVSLFGFVCFVCFVGKSNLLPMREEQRGGGRR
jgi:hypothetical protein